MGEVSRIAPEVRAVEIPAPLRDLPIFLCWRYEPRFEGDPKPLKTPWYARGNKRAGKQGTSEDRAKLTTFAVARDQAAKRGMTGVGMALLEGYDLVALDVDNCVTNQQIPDEVLQAVRSTYSELSPSGKGIRAIFRGDLGNRKARSTDTDYGIEVFSTTGYVTLTGDPLPHVDLLGLEDTIGRVTPELEALCEKRFGQRRDAATIPDDFTVGHAPALGLDGDEMAALLDKLDADMGREDWIRVGAALHHETDGGEDGFELWHDWSSTGSKFVGEDDLRTQWDSFDRRAGTRQQQVTMASVKFMAREAEQQASTPISPEEASAAAESLLGALEPSEGVETPSGYAGRFPIYQAGTLAKRPSTEWIIKGVLPAADLCVLYGASGSGKSFVALHMAATIALGLPWRGRRTRKGRVVIIAAEGAGGYGKRIKALCRQFGIEPATLDIGVMTAPPDLMKQDDITELVAAVMVAGGADLIIVDTLAQATPGANENSGEDMGLAIKHCRTLRVAADATVMLVHHAGKDLHRGARGWSGIRAAADAEIEVTRDEDTGERAIRIAKQKDGEDGLMFGFSLDIVLVGMDLDGDDETSCIVLDAEVTKREPKKGTRTRAGAGVREIGHVERLADDADESLGTDSPAEIDVASESCGIDEEEVELLGFYNNLLGGE